MKRSLIWELQLWVEGRVGFVIRPTYRDQAFGLVREFGRGHSN